MLASLALILQCTKSLSVDQLMRHEAEALGPFGHQSLLNLMLLQRREQAVKQPRLPELIFGVMLTGNGTTAAVEGSQEKSSVFGMMENAVSMTVAEPY